MRFWPLMLSIIAAGCAPVLASNPAPVVAGTADLEVPFDLPSGRPVILAQIGDAAPITVEFDTGSQGALIPRALVDKLGLKEIGEAQLASPFGGEAKTAKVVSLGSLDVAGVKATNNTAVVLEDASFMGPEARLVIGPAQFADKIMVLDYPARTLRIVSNSPFARAPWQPLKGGLLETQIVIEGQQIPLHIDSGNPGGLMLPKTIADTMSPMPDLREVGRARTVDKEFTIYLGTLERNAILANVPVKLGDVAFADVPSANLGSRGLSQFILVIDPTHQRWQLVAPGDQMPFLTARPNPA
jgi:predicted aspartyl protease